MNIFRKKGLMKKIAVACLIVMAISILPIHVSFASTVDAVEQVGGVLINGVLSLFTGLGDGIMCFLQDQLIGQEDSLFHIQKDNSLFKTLAAVVFGIAITVSAIAMISAMIASGRVFGGFEYFSFSSEVRLYLG